METLCVHLLLFHFKFYITSWILLFLNVYTAVGLVAHIKAMKMRPIVLDDNTLFLKYGLFANAKIDLSNIKNIEIENSVVDFSKDDKKFKMALLKKVERSNVKISLREDISVELFYGLSRVASEVYFYVDDKIGFLQEIERRRG